MKFDFDIDFEPQGIIFLGFILLLLSGIMTGLGSLFFAFISSSNSENLINIITTIFIPLFIFAIFLEVLRKLLR